MIRTAYIFGSLIVLVCLTGLIPMARTQLTEGRVAKSSPSHLYQVVKYDEKTGKKRFGFINNQGELIIGFDRLPKETIAINEFHDGRARIILESPKNAPLHSTYGEGYIDETGEIVIGPKPYKAHDFSNGLAMVEDSNSLTYIDLAGKVVITLRNTPIKGLPPSYKTSAKDFHEGLAAVRFQEQDDKFARRWGYIDQTGKLAIKCEYEFADDFSEGLAGVEFHGKYGFINTKGEMVIQPRFENRRSVEGDIAVHVSAGRFKEGLARVMVNHLFGYIDETGKLIIQAQFQRAQDFSDGLAGVITPDGKVGWIDKSGRWVIMGVNGKDFTPDAETTIRIGGDYQDFGYSNGLLPFTIHSDSGYIRGYVDKAGKEVIRLKEKESGFPFVDGVAKVFLANGTFDLIYGYIDTNGRFIWPKS